GETVCGARPSARAPARNASTIAWPPPPKRASGTTTSGSADNAPVDRLLQRRDRRPAVLRGTAAAERPQQPPQLRVVDQLPERGHEQIDPLPVGETAGVEHDGLVPEAEKSAQLTRPSVGHLWNPVRADGDAIGFEPRGEILPPFDLGRGHHSGGATWQRRQHR